MAPAKKTDGRSKSSSEAHNKLIKKKILSLNNPKEIEKILQMQSQTLGGVSDGDEVSGCQDNTACNYDDSATDDDG